MEFEESRKKILIELDSDEDIYFVVKRKKEEVMFEYYFSGDLKELVDLFISCAKSQDDAIKLIVSTFGNYFPFTQNLEESRNN